MTAQLSDVTGKTFDYIIIGGGTAGLTVAGRLVEDSDDVSVLVLEAGLPLLDDPRIMLGGGHGSTFGDPKYDWAFTSVPQKHSNDKVMFCPRGKGLGGSSAMNFVIWSKPPAEDIDVFEELGSPGWNWDSYQKYTMRSEDFTAATETELAEYAHTHNTEFRGNGGPVKVTAPSITLEVNNVYLEAIQKMGVRMIKDPYGGDITGCFTLSATMDRKAKWTRSYATTAYYLPNIDKPNFTVLTEAHVGRILFDDTKSDGGNLVATGVEFVFGEQTHVAYVKKELVCSAGAIKSPQILELSGIGRREVLEKIGVPVKIELDGVGENLQDHIFGGVSYELQPEYQHYKTFDILRNPELAQEQTRLHESGEPNIHRYGITAMSFLPIQFLTPQESPAIIEGLTRYIEEQKLSGQLPPGRAEQWEIQLRLLKDNNYPDVEIIGYPGYMTFRSAPAEGMTHLSFVPILQHPFSRGSVHAKTADPLDKPEIDLHLYENPYDLEMCVETTKFIRHLAQQEPLKSKLGREVDPGPEARTDDDLRNYLKSYSSAGFHAVGTLSMLPREKNGVVDAELKVYGTQNVRVADVSVVPLEVGAHPQATAYYVGERMADILKGLA